MKRQNDDANGDVPNKKRNTTDSEGIETCFSHGLFDSSTLKSYTKQYTNSQP